MSTVAYPHSRTMAINRRCVKLALAINRGDDKRERRHRAALRQLGVILRPEKDLDWFAIGEWADDWAANVRYCYRADDPLDIIAAQDRFLSLGRRIRMELIAEK